MSDDKVLRQEANFAENIHPTLGRSNRCPDRLSIHRLCYMLQDPFPHPEPIWSR